MSESSAPAKTPMLSTQPSATRPGIRSPNRPPQRCPHPQAPGTPPCTAASPSHTPDSPAAARTAHCETPHSGSFRPTPRPAAPAADRPRQRNTRGPASTCATPARRLPLRGTSSCQLAPGGVSYRTTARERERERDVSAMPTHLVVAPDWVATVPVAYVPCELTLFMAPLSIRPVPLPEIPCQYRKRRPSGLDPHPDPMSKSMPRGPHGPVAVATIDVPTSRVKP